MKISFLSFDLPSWLRGLSPQWNDVNLLALLLALPAGILAGMLINYFADVLPSTRQLTAPTCPKCGTAYTLKGYLLTRHCGQCGQRRSVRSLIVLVGATLACVLLALFPLPRLNWWASLPLVVFLGVIAVIDIEHRLVLFETSLFGLVLFFVYGVIMRGVSGTLLGGLGGLLIMFVFYLSGIGFSKIVGKLRRKNISEVAFGFGDVLFTTVLGLLMGWPGIVGAILTAFLAFGAFSIFFILGLLLSKRYQAFASALPFAPFLILGAIVIFYL